MVRNSLLLLVLVCGQRVQVTVQVLRPNAPQLSKLQRRYVPVPQKLVRIRPPDPQLRRYLLRGEQALGRRALNCTLVRCHTSHMASSARVNGPQHEKRAPRTRKQRPSLSFLAAWCAFEAKQRTLRYKPKYTANFVS